jgi:hypothetical protein
MNQEKALAILKSGKNVFLTGSAGAGKTYVLNQYIQYLKARKVPVAITASTGIAATHMNGQTIHSWAGIGVKDTLMSSDLKRLKEKQYLVNKLTNVEVLIIDEVSMLHRRQIEMVNRVLQHFKGNFEPFGGIQIVLSGDFFQLPPVSKNEETNSQKFAFMSNAWVDAKLNVCYLTEQHRQSDINLNQVLNEIRTGKVSQQSIHILDEAQHVRLKDKSPTQLYSHNFDVDRINTQYLEELRGDAILFKATTKGNLQMAEMLTKSVLTSENLYLKIGAKVMFVKNNYEEGYMNGTLGEVVDFIDEEDEEELIIPVVKTYDGREIHVHREKWSIDNESGKPLVSFIQIPLRLGWAITVHKSQGMTLDAAEIDLSKTFEKGQGYVALSRVKDLEGLKLIGYNEIALEVDSLALKADARFQELSAEIDQKYALSELESSFSPFILRCGGTINQAAIRLEEDKLNRKISGVKKKSTYEMTKELIENGLGLEEIAEHRGLNTTTIINHLQKISTDFPNVNLDKFRPEESLIKKIQQAKDALLKEDAALHSSAKGIIKVGSIYHYFKGEIEYSDIHLALVYVK